MTSTPIRITGVDFAYIPVTDFDAAKRFYGEVLGLEQSKQYGNMPGGEFETGTLTLGGSAEEASIGRSQRPRQRRPSRDCSGVSTAAVGF